MLVAEGTLLLKLWFHLSKKAQKARLEGLAEKQRTRWRVTDVDWKHFELYDKFRKVSERVLRETSTAAAPWLVIDGSDHRYRSLTAARALLDAMRSRLDASAAPAPVIQAAPFVRSIDGVHVLGALEPTPTFVTNYAIYPFVGLIEPGFEWVIGETEVAEVLELRLDTLRSAFEERRLVRKGIPFRTPTYEVDGHLIWGATGRILQDLLDRI